MKMERLVTICAVVGLTMAVTGTAQAALDIEGIYIDSCMDYEDGIAEPDPWCFEMWVDIAAQNGLHHIDIILPAGSAIPTIILTEAGDWEYESLTDYSTLADLQADHSTGIYRFEFKDISNDILDWVELDYSGLSGPGNHVGFTYPAHGATDVPLNPMYRWDVDSGDGDALGMWVWDPVEDEDKYWDDAASMSTIEWQPGLLDPGHVYELEVGVFTAKGGLPGPALPTTTTNGGDGLEYGLLMEYINGIEFTTVPEPATVALLGLGSLVLFHRSKKNVNSIKRGK